MRRSFDDIFAEHGPAIARVVANYTDQGADREDLLQDAWVTIWRSHKHFLGESALGTYLLRIAHNRSATWLRRSQRKLKLEDEQIEVAGIEVNPEVDASGQQKALRLMEAIRTLPLKQRQTVSLVLEGLNYKEVGEVLELSENTDGVRVHRAWQKIRSAMERCD